MGPDIGQFLPPDRPQDALWEQDRKAPVRSGHRALIDACHLADLISTLAEDADGIPGLEVVKLLVEPGDKHRRQVCLAPIPCKKALVPALKERGGHIRAASNAGESVPIRQRPEVHLFGEAGQEAGFPLLQQRRMGADRAVCMAL